GPPAHPVDEVAGCRWRRQALPIRLYAQSLQSGYDPLHGTFGITEELAPPNPDEPPTQPLENRLAGEVLDEFLRGMEPVAVAFDRDFRAVGPLYDQVNPVVPHPPLRRDTITPTYELCDDLFLEFGLGAALCAARGFDHGVGVLRVLDQAKTEISMLEIRGRVERVDHPHLVSRATRGDIEPFLVFIEIAVAHKRKRPPAKRAGLDHGQEDNVTLVALELSRIPAKNLPVFYDLGGEVVADDLFNQHSLFVAQEGDHPERLTRVLGLFDRCHE